MRLLAFFLLVTFATSAQTLELTPRGFAPVTFKTPNKPSDKLMEAVKTWAATYNKKGHDVYDVTANSATVDALRESAYFYRNLGQRYDYNIVYSLKIDFNDDKTYTLTFSVKQVYAKEVPVKTTVADFFAPDGRLKDDYVEVKPSLENTANKIVSAFVDFLDRY